MKIFKAEFEGKKSIKNSRKRWQKAIKNDIIVLYGNYRLKDRNKW